MYALLDVCVVVCCAAIIRGRLFGSKALLIVDFFLVLVEIELHYCKSCFCTLCRGDDCTGDHCIGDHCTRDDCTGDHCTRDDCTGDHCTLQV